MVLQPEREPWPTERIDYDPIEGRPALHLPGGARVAVWLIVNVEEWSATEPMPRTVLTPPAGGVPSPDVPNWAWHEYGNRVGFWRMLRVLDRHAIPVSLAVNGSAIEAYPQITAAAVRRRWEYIGHGYTQKKAAPGGGGDGVAGELECRAARGTYTALRDRLG